ncbi:hypothetical protein PAXINDRAFT_168779 [Paxillus involutus ATCC 200175]|uniref:Uncharacterized protein n=1 Tax=Paxillus involutus ATCC 200175 TaxID=664439 RepID=A0A0C9U9V6_PAXIN|nr:hypothetical protein PAXINDRAFT_168779 [Paxillus involutus ATCC 200175]
MSSVTLRVQVAPGDISRSPARRSHAVVSLLEGSGSYAPPGASVILWHGVSYCW